MNFGRLLLGPTGRFVVFSLLMVAVAPPVVAFQLGDIPVTAEFAAGMRAIAAMEPDEKIRNPDGMARQFLSPAFWFWTALDEDYEKSKQFIRHYRVATYYEHNARTQHIDGILQAAADSGCRQVVIIGAGLDSRAYRFHDRWTDLRFYEVDLPAAAARKQELVREVVGQLPAYVAYVPVDYREAEMDGALKRAGFAPTAPSLFICEGVTRYIDASAVDRILTFIADNAPAGSQLVFDYIADDIARGDYSKMPGARFQAVRMTAYGHPWRFGIAPDQAGDFVKRHGFGVISNLDAGQLAERYLLRSDGSLDGRPAPYVHILHAGVD